VGLYGDDFDFDAHGFCMLGELLACELLSGVRNKLVGRA
jgi:hypothetical protein